MTTLPSTTLGGLEPENLSIGLGLCELLKYGKPGISYIPRGWHCRLDMYVQGSGVEFKIASDFDCPTPEAALRQCKLRLQQTLSTLKG